MLYKYSEFTSQIIGCPPTHYRNEEITVFRWVHENMRHINDFLPVAFINPKRVNDPTIDLAHKCRSYGLSLYNSVANAQKQYNAIIAQNPRLVQQIGEYIAEAQLAKSDGVISPADPRTGHMTFHEYAGVDLQRKFTIIERAKYDR